MFDLNFSYRIMPVVHLGGQVTNTVNAGVDMNISFGTTGITLPAITKRRTGNAYRFMEASSYRRSRPTCLPTLDARYVLALDDVERRIYVVEYTPFCIGSQVRSGLPGDFP